jgi:hypothetical protein
MANQISTEYLKNGFVTIPNIDGSNEINTAIKNTLELYIGIKEPQYLLLMLGADLYAEYLLGIAVVPTPLAKWTNLKNQLLNSTLKISPIANYAYFFYAQEKISKEISEETPNFFTFNRCVQAWNEMVKMNLVIYKFLFDNIDTYTSFAPDYENEQYLELFKPLNNFGI